VGTRLPDVAARPARPLLVFDGDCRFCRFWIARWKGITGDLLVYATSQDAGERFPEIAPEEFRRAVVLVLPTGEAYSGADAVVRALAEVPGRGRWRWFYERVPGARPITNAVYRAIADHRDSAYRFTRLFWGGVPQTPTYFRASALFLRLLALCYLAAFLSLWVQVDGLIGPRGIAPAENYLEWVRSQVGAARFWLVPTLAWLGAGPGTLHLLCGGGAVAALLVFFGLAPTLALAAAWVCYLSLASISQVFLSYQWDALLLETGLLAIFLSPPSWRLRLSAAAPPSRTALLLLRWLLFRLMFSSGVVKLGSGDAAWRSLTALRVHYETQPLPTPIAWFLHQLPAGFQTLSCVFLFAVELAVPFLVFAPRRAKLLAFVLLVTLQVLIAVSGNYAFFNWLAVALCFLLLDDAAFPPRRAPPAPAEIPAGPRKRWPVPILAPLATVLFVTSFVQLVLTVRRNAEGIPRPALHLLEWISPLESVNRYGLFAVMTMRRPEIVVEGSEDGRTWRPYEFRWKPGDVSVAPKFVAPHQPRLDWQMWFAALESCGENRWLIAFLGRLLQGEPAVLRLLAANPFPKGPPRYVRTLVYSYRFTDWKTRRSTGAWWTRQLQGGYCPVVSRDMLGTGVNAE
jgi:predicted DCC family thiol-disulfide oxidoreductase YuxK